MNRLARGGLGVACQPRWLWLLGFVLWGCDIFSVQNFMPRPSQINPESDAFSDSAQRAYLWTEGTRNSALDSQTLRTVTLQVRDRGNLSSGGDVVRRLDVVAEDGTALPVSVLSDLGFTPSRVSFDTTAIPDPGFDLGYPQHPEIGWRAEKTVGNLRWVRELIRLDTLKVGGSRLEAWRFADTAYWMESGQGQALKYSTRWFAGTGLLRCHAEWASIGPGSPAGFWREVTAQ